ncbi:hypothetical protein CERSUDRAFT_120099, partial [Gelatoporia subvermispora B]
MAMQHCANMGREEVDIKIVVQMLHKITSLVYCFQGLRLMLHTRNTPIIQHPNSDVFAARLRQSLLELWKWGEGVECPRHRIETINQH